MNKGLTVKINLWPVSRDLAEVSAERARLWIKGQVTNIESKQVKKFNDAGELITVLGKWNVKKVQSLKEISRKLNVN
jgi:hypothetical protein